MEHDKPGSVDPSSAFDTVDEGGDEANARSVTDLIDSIERNAFKRYISVREHRRQYAWSFEERLEH